MVDLAAPDKSIPPEGPPSVAVGHETRDVRFRPIVIAAVALVVVTAAVAQSMRVLLNFFASRESRASAPASPLAGAYGRHVPPEPRLQTHPVEDLERLRALESAALGTYEWVDREAGLVRIPIERAMDVLAERGLTANASGGAGSAMADAATGRRGADARAPVRADR